MASFRVRIEISGQGTRYPARVDHGSFLTTRKEDARQYRNHVNADIDAKKWTITLLCLGLDVDAFLEEYTT